MRALLQRVQNASVTIDQKVTAQIGHGILVLLGIEDADLDEDIEWLCQKITQLRIFNDEAGVMNVSIKDAGHEILLVSQFTLMASVKKGNRPSYIRASKPEKAIPLYEKFISKIEAALGKKVATGTFGADMKIALINDGPVTIFIDSKSRE